MDWVEFSVGGQRFSSTWNTLSRADYFLSLAQRWNQTEIKIDRDPGLFAVVLSFLRTRILNTATYSLEQVLHEFDYYGVAYSAKPEIKLWGKIDGGLWKPSDPVELNNAPLEPKLYNQLMQEQPYSQLIELLQTQGYRQYSISNVWYSGELSQCMVLTMR